MHRSPSICHPGGTENLSRGTACRGPAASRRGAPPVLAHACRSAIVEDQLVAPGVVDATRNLAARARRPLPWPGSSLECGDGQGCARVTSAGTVELFAVQECKSTSP